MPLPSPNGSCPICQRPVVVAGNTYLGSMYSGPMMAPRTSEELVAACAVHGRSPFNDASIEAVGADAGENPEADPSG